jgi:hypothetical protein
MEDCNVADTPESFITQENAEKLWELSEQLVDPVLARLETSTDPLDKMVAK